MIISLELNWIKKKLDKCLIYPSLVFSKSLNYAGGVYHHPENSEICIDDEFFSLNNGLIEISVEHNYETKCLESTICHELRHHWQFFNKPKVEYRLYWQPEYNHNFEVYKCFIKKYFTVNISEFDALLFQKKFTSIFDEWEEWLYEDLKLYA